MPAAEDPVDEAEVGRGDVDDADRGQHDEGDQPDLGAAPVMRAPPNRARVPARLGRACRCRARTVSERPRTPVEDAVDDVGQLVERDVGHLVEDCADLVVLVLVLLALLLQPVEQVDVGEHLLAGVAGDVAALQALLDVVEHLDRVRDVDRRDVDRRQLAAASGQEVVEADLGADRGVGVVALDDLRGLLGEREADQQVESRRQLVAGGVQLGQHRLAGARSDS